MNVESILKRKGREVVTIAQHASIQQAAEKMAKRNIGALVVTQGDKVLGIVTTRDIAHALAESGWHLVDLRIADVMHADIVTVDPDDNIRQVMELMTRRRVTHMPVFRSGRLAGLVSIGDIVKYRVEELELETSVLRDAYIAVH
jgi:CBS domain-containing protein